jgi:hypothetical protein
MFAANQSLNDLMDDLMHLVDDHTEYFKSHLDNLAPIERKVYLALAEIWEPAMTRDVAEVARLNVNKTSALLKRLVDRGFVVVTETGKHIQWYQLAERLYNIYYLMRRRGGPSNRVQAIVKFMVSFYGEEELAGITRKIIEEANDLDGDLRQDYYSVCEMIFQNTPDDIRKKIVNDVSCSFSNNKYIPHFLRESFAENYGAPLPQDDRLDDDKFGKDNPFRNRKQTKALQLAERLYNNPALISKNIELAISLGVLLGNVGAAHQTIDMLQASPCATLLEPLIVGLRLFLGEKVRAPKEVLSVGEDVAERIRALRDAGI